MHLSLAEAETLVVEALQRSKVSDGNARSVAVALVAAEAAGQGGHGLRPPMPGRPRSARPMVSQRRR